MTSYFWTQQDKDRVAVLLEEGKTAREIGEALGNTRNAIIGIVARDKRLAAIGFAKKSNYTPEQRLERRRKYDEAYRERNKGKVIQFPKPFRERQTNSRQKPRLIVVSSNVPMMVQDWMAKNGGARKFGERETTQSWEMRSFLADRGVTVGFVRGSDKWNLSRDGGRPRIVKWADIMRLVDEIRIAEGLQPFSVSAPRRKQGAVA